jgi:arylsulfatase A-like enzyme
MVLDLFRGTNNPNLAPLPANTTCTGLMHTTDWFPTLVEGVPRGTIEENQTLPLDGYNQWEVSAGRETTSKRTTIFHQVPVGGEAIRMMSNNYSSINKKGDDVSHTSSMCMH